MVNFAVGTAMYYALVSVAAKYRISVAEVHLTLLRQAAVDYLGFKCNHPYEGLVFNKQHKPYCRLCFTLMKKAKSKKGFITTGFDFVPKKSFIEIMKEEKAKAAAALDPMGGLRPDRRGGE